MMLYLARRREHLDSGTTHWLPIMAKLFVSKTTAINYACRQRPLPQDEPWLGIGEH